MAIERLTDLDRLSTHPNEAVDTSVLRVDKSEGRWEAIPHALINDDRLSLDAVGLAAWFLARPPHWEIRIGALPHMLKNRSSAAGREKVGRLLRELERAGYLSRSKHRLPTGHWAWRSSFRAVSRRITIDGLAVDGSASDGKAVDIDHTVLNNRRDHSILDQTTTESRSKAAVVGGDLRIDYPECLSGSRRAATQALIARCPECHRQPVLDEIAAMATRGNLRSPLGLLRRRVENAQVGCFAPNPSLDPFRPCRRTLKTRDDDSKAPQERYTMAGPTQASEVARRTLLKIRETLIP